MKMKMKYSMDSARCKELFLKLFALGLGTLIWFLVVGADQMDMTLTVPVEVLNLPKNLVISGPPQKEVQVTLRGPRSIMQEMRSRSLSLPLDLAKAKPETLIISADSLALPLPSGIAVVRMQPASLTLCIDQFAQKHLPVTAETEGKPAPGYILKELSLSPDRILVSGPKKLLEGQQNLKTHPVNLEGLNHSAVLPVRLNLSPSFLSLLGETTVVANIAIREKFAEKIVHKIPVRVTDAVVPVAVKPETVSVFASIPESILANGTDPAALFAASVEIGGEELPRKVPISVTAMPVPGHEPIAVRSHTPLEAEIIPVRKKAQGGAR
jgi:hypothetical protein